MNWPLSPDATALLAVLLLLLGTILVITLVMVVWVAVWVRRINLPPYADFVTALHATPLVVVVILDLLDLSLDVLSAPLSWFLLGKLGLAPLRPVAVVKDLIPFTNFVPLMTLCWAYAHFVAHENDKFPVGSLRHLSGLRGRVRNLTARSK